MAVSTRSPTGLSRFDTQFLALDLYRPGTHRPRGGAAQDRAGGHVELTTMAGARHRGPIQRALRERAPHMGALVIKCVKISAHTCDSHVDSRNIKDPHLSRADGF